jgi:hypothetical protein
VQTKKTPNSPHLNELFGMPRKEVATLYITERKHDSRGNNQVRNVASAVGHKNALKLLKEFQTKRPSSVFKIKYTPVNNWDVEATPQEA